MKAIENDLWDVYRYLLDKGASGDTARNALLNVARDKLPEADTAALAEVTSRVIEHFRRRNAEPSSEPYKRA
jgi:hypothetical protein